MNKHKNATDDVYLQAAQWLDRLSDGPLDNISKKRFTNWLAADELHQATFDDMLATWQDASMEQAVRVAKQALSWREKIAQKPQPMWWVAGMSLAISILVAVVLLPGQVSPLAPVSQDYSTAKAERKDVLLEDGSSLELSSDTAIYVSFSPEKRTLHLKNGASYFAVASDKQRPFEVNLGGATVTAVGTQFNIDRSLHGSDITVYEGAVEVRAAHNAPPILLRAGEAIYVGKSGVSEVQAVDLSQLVDWRTGWIEIANKPLSYLVERLNRESQTNITVASATIADLPVAGRFRLRDTQQTLAMLSEVYGLVVTEQDQQIIVSAHNL